MKCYDCFMSSKVFEACPKHGRKLRKVRSVKVIILKPIITTHHWCPCGEFNCHRFCSVD